MSGAADDARGDHVGARAALLELTREVLELLKVLDGLNTVRLAGQADLLAEWTSARNVFGPVSRGSAVTPPEQLGGLEEAA
ncbi:MAG TPA: hypothetical protein PLL69_09415 [Gemmatimonadales bacterium]|nr:hypothetical protein [Gemmatimonadales bacterium]